MIDQLRTFVGTAIIGMVVLGCSKDSTAPATPGQDSKNTPVATHLAFFDQPTSTISASQPLGKVSVQLLAADGHLAAGTTYQVTMALSAPPDTVVYEYPRYAADTAAHLTGTTTVSTSTGIATFSDLSVARAKAGFKLVARVTGVDSAISQTFTVTPGPAVRMRFDILGPIEVATEAPVVVRISDSVGNTVTSATNPITVDYTRTGSFGFTLAPDDTFGPVITTAVSGVATVHGLVFHKSGTYTLTATSPGLPSATSSSGFAVAGVNFTRLIFVAQPTDTGVGAVLPVFAVQQIDDYGNGMMPAHSPSLVSATVAIGKNPSGAALGGTVTVQALRGSPLNFGDITINAPGAGYTLVVTSGSVSATSAPFNIK